MRSARWRRPEGRSSSPPRGRSPPVRPGARSSTPSAPGGTSSPQSWRRRERRWPGGGVTASVREAEPLRGLTIDIPVRFAECDPYGVVWHGHYVLYLEHAREALTGKFGFTAARALEMGYRVPVTRMELKYRLPARPDQTIRVTTRLRAPSVARFVMDYEIRDEPGRLLASAVTEQVVVNAQGELLLTLPSGLRALCASILEYQDTLDAASR